MESAASSEADEDQPIATDRILIFRNCRTDLDECAHGPMLHHIPGRTGSPERSLRASIGIEGHFLELTNVPGFRQRSYMSEYRLYSERL